MAHTLIKNRVPSFIGCAMALAAAISGCASTQDAVSEQPAPTSASASAAGLPVEVIYTGTLPFTQALLQQTASDPAQRTSAIQLVEGWATSNETVSVPGPDADNPQILTTSDVDALLTQLKTPGDGALGATPSYSGQPVIGANVGYNPDDPFTFPVEGHKGDGNTFWTGMELFIARAVCEHSTCHDTDRYTSNVTINPGPTATRFNTRNRYFPTTGLFGNKHIKMWAISNNEIVGRDNSGQLPAAGTDYVRYASRKGHPLQQAVTLWVYLNNHAQYAGHSGKTTAGHCASSPSDNRCHYK